MPYRYDSSAYRDAFDNNFSYLAGFWRNVRRYGDRPALIDPGLTGPARTWTYAELAAVVAELAQGLADRGVRAGDVVTFQLYNCPEFAQLYLAAEQLGAIASPINFRFSPGETAHVLDDSVPKVLVYDGSLGESVRAALELAEHRPDVLVAVDGDPGLDGAEAFDQLPAGPGIRSPQGDLTAWDETLRLYTSGTTGMPKGVSLNNAAEVLTAHDVIMHFPLTPQDRTLNMTPWFHRGGISAGGPQPVLYAGAASVVMRQFDADAVLDLVQAERLTFLIGAPTNLGLLTAAQETNPRDLSSLRGIVTMGAPLERAACLRFQSVLTPRIFNGYGTTEAFWNTFLRPADLPDHAGSAGQACTDDDVRVVNAYEDHPADPDDLAPRDGVTTGEVIMRSLKSGYAYVNKPDEQQAKFRDGWLYSGDLGTWDADEFVTVVGRKDDMIISGGENVHPVQVEEVLNSHPSVADAIVVGLPDERWGELVVACVQTDDSELTAAELDKYCLASPMLADFKRPRRYRFVAELPRTATGKKMHYVIREEIRRPGAAAELQSP
ncbi:class I adenylate-forming enzyme family protein [Microlunatus soli]|uniref:Acyl-CoA synthetase (AMP-forming)/AMP-acid ligase II n=1 Tax=Microlunatus soli TaxID=630515 RepID=A0A1H1RVG8_9ACTN|nr:AMP-binding protein [Microlunatus soli]SDS39546.1 Acyl-CoA synthetase (AMP-forming)/AMP-acid ligase II [Microlunatus soli]